MHNNDPVLSKEINDLIVKYDLLNPIKSNDDILETDEFFTELDEAFQRRKEEKFNEFKNRPAQPVKINDFNFPVYDFTSLYPTVMKDFTKDSKFMAELKRAERKRKLEKINNICVGADQKEHQENQE